jgi:protein-S-isoprenylcysteine O-methyltransferase Ste14
VGLLGEAWVMNRRARGPQQDKDSGSLRLIFWAEGAGLLLMAVTFLFQPPLRTATSVMALGLVLAWGGLLLRWVAIRQLGRHFTYRVSAVSEPVLVRDGLYRHLRHPSYLGLGLYYIGLPLTTGRFAGLLCFTLPCLLALFNRMKIEERALREIFGAEYAQYSKRTSSLIPFL